MAISLEESPEVEGYGFGTVRFGQPDPWFGARKLSVAAGLFQGGHEDLLIQSAGVSKTLPSSRNDPDAGAR
jgi:hypothetical protein